MVRLNSLCVRSEFWIKLLLKRKELNQMIFGNHNKSHNNHTNNNSYSNNGNKDIFLVSLFYSHVTLMFTIVQRYKRARKFFYHNQMFIATHLINIAFVSNSRKVLQTIFETQKISSWYSEKKCFTEYTKKNCPEISTGMLTQ